MSRSNIFQRLPISQEKLAEAKSRMLAHLCEPTLCRMCDILDIAQQDSILQEAIEDRAFVAVDDVLEDGQCFHIFDNMEFQYAISMIEQPKPCSVETSAFS